MLGAVGLAGDTPLIIIVVVQSFKYSNTILRQTEHLCLCGQNFLLLLFFVANSSRNVYGRGL